MEETPVLGKSGGLLELTTAAGQRDTALAMAQQARRSIIIFTRDLDPAIYDTDAFADACSALARSSPRAEVQILVQDASRAAREGHRLVRLAQRLSSKVAIYKPHPEYAKYNSAFMVVDEVAYIRRTLADRMEGSADFNDSPAARELSKFFREVWEKSHAAPQLRRLHV